MRKLPNADFNFGFGKLGITSGSSAQVKNSNTSAESNSVGRAPVQDLDTINLWEKSITNCWLFKDFFYMPVISDMVVFI